MIKTELGATGSASYNPVASHGGLCPASTSFTSSSPGTARSGMLFLLHSSLFGPTPSLCPELSLLCVAAGLWQGGAAHHEVPAPVWSPLHLRWGDRWGYLQSQRDQPQGAGRLRESELSLF